MARGDDAGDFKSQKILKRVLTLYFYIFDN